MLDRSKPFQMLLHDGTFTNLDYQPARDFVGIGGVADLDVIKQQYYHNLVAGGMSIAVAKIRADDVKGGISVMTEQFLVMGMDRGIILEDKEQNRRAWMMAAKSGHAFGQRVGQVTETPKRRPDYILEPLVRPNVFDRVQETKVNNLASISDDISAKLKRAQKLRQQRDQN